MEAVSGSKSLSGCSCWSQIQREITAEFRSTSARVSVPVCSRRWCRKESQRSAAYFSCSSTLKPETNPRQDLQTSKKDLKLDSETRCSEEEEWCEFLFLLQLQNKMKQTKKKNSQILSRIRPRRDPSEILNFIHSRTFTRLLKEENDAAAQTERRN